MIWIAAVIPAFIIQSTACLPAGYVFIITIAILAVPIWHGYTGFSDAIAVPNWLVIPVLLRFDTQAMLENDGCCCWGAAVSYCWSLLCRSLLMIPPVNVDFVVGVRFCK